MKDDLRKILDDTINNTEKAKSDADERRRLSQEKSSAFLDQFVALRKDMLDPALKEIGEHMEKRGYKFHIKETCDQIPNNSTEGSKASITIELELISPRFQSPYFRIECDKTAQYIRFYRSWKPGENRELADGECRIEEVTKELVQEKIVNMIKDNLR